MRILKKILKKNTDNYKKFNLLKVVKYYFSITKVSFEPPPWELFTIVLPFFKATLVSPPVVTHDVLPERTKALNLSVLVQYHHLR